MEGSRRQSRTLKWFNTQLFTMNGSSLKFNLNGYSDDDFSAIVKIIKAYGGELSRTDAPDTFIFCDPDHALREQKWNLYDIRFFYDSILALEPQNLQNYKLPTDKQPNEIDLTDDESPTLKNEDQIVNELEESLDFKLRISTDEDSSFVNDGPLSEVKDKGGNDELQQMIDRLSDHKLVDSDNNVTSHEQSNFEDNVPVKSRPSGPECLMKLMEKNTAARMRTSSRLREKAQIVHVDSLNDHEKPIMNINIWTNKNSNIGGDRTGDHNVIPASSLASLIEENGNVVDSKVSRITRNSKAQSNNKKYAIRNIGCSSTAIDNRQRRAGRPKTTLSENENEAIINWLINNEIVPSLSGRKIWQQFIEEGILPSIPQRNITAGLLVRHFNKELRKHPAFVKYVENLRASKRAKLPREPYTQKENRLLVKYLIDNDVIHRATGTTVWKECLEKNKALLNPRRTAYNLALHFRQVLRHSYVTYTDEPEALRKFEEIEEYEEKSSSVEEPDTE